MKVIDVKKQPIKENAHKVDARAVFASEHILLVHMEIEQGKSLLPHITPVDVVFYVLEGEGTVTVGEEKAIVKKNQAVFSPKDIKHNWANTGTGTLRILVMKTPKPQKATKIL
ncbi:MAG: cupin domain-containing protein [Candidatus Zixiibacteriota bacterium]